MKAVHRTGLITVVVLFAVGVTLFQPDFSKQVYSQIPKIITYETMPVNKYDLVHDSELIKLGEVVDQNSQGTRRKTS
jgi:hypothetical protein